MAGTDKISFIQRFSKVQQATAVAIFFHTIGLAGMLCGKVSFFNAATAINLLLMLGLLIFAEEKLTRHWWYYLLICFITGMSVEWVGVHTGWLFGNYAYGDVLGPKLWGVPLMIGVNWFIVMYGSAVLMKKVSDRLSVSATMPAWFKYLLMAIDAACVAVLFDWIMEPVAVQLGYWQWGGNGAIPLFNYVSWFIVSWLLQIVFFLLPIKNTNLFAVHLLLIQAMFFLILRTFL